MSENEGDINILDQILVDFFKDLEDDEIIPDYVIDNLKNLKTSELSSKEKILESIKRDDSDEN